MWPQSHWNTGFLAHQPHRVGDGNKDRVHRAQPATVRTVRLSATVEAQVGRCVSVSARALLLPGLWELAPCGHRCPTAAHTVRNLTRSLGGLKGISPFWLLRPSGHTPVLTQLRGRPEVSPRARRGGEPGGWASQREGTGCPTLGILCAGTDWPSPPALEEGGLWSRVTPGLSPWGHNETRLVCGQRCDQTRPHSHAQGTAAAFQTSPQSWSPLPSQAERA